MIPNRSCVDVSARLFAPLFPFAPRNEHLSRVDSIPIISARLLKFPKKRQKKRKDRKKERKRERKGKEPAEIKMSAILPGSSDYPFIIGRIYFTACRKYGRQNTAKQFPSASSCPFEINYYCEA